MRIRQAVRRCIPVVLVGLLLAAGSVLPALGEGGPAAGADRAAKLKRLFKAAGYEERVRLFARKRVESALGVDAAKADAVIAKFAWDPVHAVFLKAMDARVDDKGMDAALALLEGPNAAQARALVELAGNLRGLEEILEDRDSWVDREKDRALGPNLSFAVDAAVEKASPESGALVNERAAIRALRNLASCQAEIQTAGYIDCDGDGIGEYGTFMELAAATPLRGEGPGGPSSVSDFSRTGRPARAPIIAPLFAAVDGNGIVTKSGYCFRLFLPDSAKPPATGFAHETGPAAKPGLAGGTGKVGVELAEVMWCAYAWPEKRGSSGNRVFFINHTGDVRSSTGEVAQWSGLGKAPEGNSAFTGKFFVDGQVAGGKKGSDGDLWTVVE